MSKVHIRNGKWRDSDRVAFSLVGCDSAALAADGGLSFVCPTAAISNTACNLDNLEIANVELERRVRIYSIGEIMVLEPFEPFK